MIGWLQSICKAVVLAINIYFPTYYRISIVNVINVYILSENRLYINPYMLERNLKERHSVIYLNFVNVMV